ncbi:MAG: NAD(P)/FAD-dependent oxidoreductase [Aquabacterium sp.]
MTDTDAVVIGAGPVGLFQVFQLGLLGLRAHVIDVLPEPGGQCVALYPDKPIYDVPGVPRCTGRELTRLLLTQAQPFLPALAPASTDASGPGASGSSPYANVHLGQQVAGLARAEDGRWLVTSSRGLQWRARAVFVAAGAGAFVPRSLNLPGLQDAGNVHFHAPEAGALPWAGQHVVVAGGGDEALASVVSLANEADPARRPARLTLLHRREVFQAEPELDAAVRALIAEGRVALCVGMPTEAQVAKATVESLAILSPDETHHPLPLDHLLVRQGMSPKLGPLTDWGMALERKQIVVDTGTFETSLPQVYAVGDINTYPGKKRLLLCGFHEATMAAHAAAAALNPGSPQHLLYTTTSPLLRERLGVA